MADVLTRAPTAYRWRRLALIAVLAAEIMDLVDDTVVGIAAPSIRAELGGGDALIQWVAAGYTLAFAPGLITGGRLGDLYGRRRMFLVGLVGVRRRVGAVRGVLNANQQLGGTVGVAVLGTVFFDLFDAGRPTAAMVAVLVLSAALVLAAGALAFLLPRRAR